MVNADFINVLNTTLVALAAKYGVPAPDGFRSWHNDTCVVSFPKDTANGHREGISGISAGLEEVDGVVEVSDTWSDHPLFRGIEKRDVYVTVRRNLWKRTAADKAEEESWDDEEFNAKKQAEEQAAKRKFYKDYLLPIPPPTPSHPTELYLTMAYEPYDLIRKGEKVTEFRAYCESWVKRILANRETLKTVKFQRGYGGPGRPKPEQMVWTIRNIELYDIETRESSDPVNVKEGFVPSHIAIDLGVRMDDVGPTTQKEK